MGGSSIFLVFTLGSVRLPGAHVVRGASSFARAAKEEDSVQVLEVLSLSRHAENNSCLRSANCKAMDGLFVRAQCFCIFASVTRGEDVAICLCKRTWVFFFLCRLKYLRNVVWGVSNFFM